jgi:preprotein translocase subunit SecE
MKRSEDRDKRKREKGQPSVGAQTGAGVERAPQEERNRGGQPLPRKEGRKEEKGFVFRYAGIAGQFVRESRTELKKVKWPTRKELLASTAAVIVLVLVVSVYLGLIDLGLVKIIQNIVG